MIMDKPIYICENHEMAFYYWCKGKKEMKIDVFFLVTVDRHTDLMEWGRQSDIRKEVNRLDLNDLIKIKELASRSRIQKNNLAYRQPRAAMEAGLVGDMLLISHEAPYEEIYEDLSKRKHRIFHCVHPNGLKDLLMKNKILRRSIGYDKNADANLILDIDLDFFTYLDQHDIPHVISEEDFKEIFSSDSLLWWIYKKARLVTISKESFWCGGIDNSEHIFKLLKTYFLNKQTTNA